jgi:hypothetical protein
VKKQKQKTITSYLPVWCGDPHAAAVVKSENKTKQNKTKIYY